MSLQLLLQQDFPIGQHSANALGGGPGRKRCADNSVDVSSHPKSIFPGFPFELRVPALRRQIVKRFMKGQDSHAPDMAGRFENDQECFGLGPDIMDFDMGVAKKNVVPIGRVQNDEFRIDVIPCQLFDALDFR